MQKRQLVTTPHLVFRELKINFVQSIVGIAGIFCAVAIVMAVYTVLKGHQNQTLFVLESFTAKTKSDMKEMEMDYTSIAATVGYTLRIISENEDHGAFLVQGFSSTPLSPEYIDSLRKSPPKTVHHLLPIGKKKIVWPEQRRTIYVIAYDEELPSSIPPGGKPITLPLEKGHVAVGEQLCWTYKLEKGSTIRFHGQDFIVGECKAHRGSIEDITIFMTTEDAKTIFPDGKIFNEIVGQGIAVTKERTKRIRDEIHSLFPSLQVIEIRSEAIGRAKTIEAAQRHALRALEQEQTNAAKLRNQQRVLLSVIIGCAVIISLLWIAISSVINIRSRSAEIGILRAIGISAKEIVFLALYRALFVGFLGAVTGAIIGMFIGNILLTHQTIPSLWDWHFFFAATVSALLISVLAVLWPAYESLRQHPAEVLGRE